ncbi:sperm acrosome-associated protein 7 [Nycticebus coucang]|uniref:sperm acrosome-associated protein 7 n=1 Tax=Nycticebus coucang TaxID=9470 RepID=UPI00234D1045|nr:sperm acrosome-associated protein 7 [Nycticebus coucang]
MAMNRGAGILFVLLLCCWQETKFQPLTTTTGSTTDMLLSSKSQDMPGLFDEILVQEILDPNKTALAETTSIVSTMAEKLAEEKNAGSDTNSQSASAENYHELLDSLHFSSGNEDKVFNNEPSAKETLQASSSSKKYKGSRLSLGNEGTTSGKGKKSSKNDQSKRVSVLDKILQNIERTSGNIFQ